MAAIIGTLLFFLLFQPLAASAAARQLTELALVAQTSLNTSTGETISPRTGEASPDTLSLVDDAAVPRLDPPSTQWSRLIADRLPQGSSGRILLRTAPGDPNIYLSVDTDQHRYWLKLPVDRLSTRMPFFLSLIIAFSLVLCFSTAVVSSARHRARITRFSDALRQVGTGDVAAQLAETGGHAEREFSEAFNAMARSLQRVDAESRLLLGGISHDLRTPLTSMRLGLELAKDEMEPGLAASLYQDSQDLESILNQFLDYARDDTLEAVEIGDLNELILEAAKRVTDHGHHIDLDLAPLPLFHFRKLAMRRLITNLVNNAINYAGVGVGVRSRAQGSGYVMVSVIDSGPGVDEAQLEGLMRPFVRGLLSDNRHPGSGLGHTIASRITRIHGGTLKLRNRPEGGLEAQIELPIRYDQG